MLVLFFFLMIRRPPRSTLFPYTDALPIYLTLTQSSNRLSILLYFSSKQIDTFITASTTFYCHRYQLTLLDRKSTRLNSSHANISYAVFCLKKKKKYTIHSSSEFISHLTLR